MSGAKALFRLQDSESRTYRVFPGGPYATIQAAIDQADTDLGGVGSPNDSATVIVSSKGSVYTEDLTLKRGIYLTTDSANYGRFREPVSIVGEHTFTPDASGSFNNSLIIQGFRLRNTTVAKSIIKMVGANAGRLQINACSLDQSASAAPAVDHATSGGSSSRIFLNDCDLFADGSGIGGAVGIGVSGNGRVQVEDCLLDVEFGAGANHVVEVTGGGQCRILGNYLIFCDGDPESFLITAGQLWIFDGAINQFASGTGRNLIEMGAGTGLLNIRNVVIDHADSGLIVKGTAGTVNMRGNVYSQAFPGIDPALLSVYLGAQGSTDQTRKSNFFATVAPGITDDDSAGYDYGSFWVDRTAGDHYACVDPSTGAAVWKKTTP
jgi:hypothetical protein